MLIAVAGVGIIYGSIGIVAEAVVAEASSQRREARRMAEAVAGLTGHYILCGYGRVGSTVARELVHAGQRLVVIDIEPASLERARRDGHLVVEGDATSDETLRLAGIDPVGRGRPLPVDDRGADPVSPGRYRRWQLLLPSPRPAGCSAEPSHRPEPNFANWTCNLSYHLDWYISGPTPCWPERRCLLGYRYRAPAPLHPGECSVCIVYERAPVTDFRIRPQMVLELRYIVRPIDSRAGSE
jgi:hypothetical protein